GHAVLIVLLHRDEAQPVAALGAVRLRGRVYHARACVELESDSEAHRPIDWVTAADARVAADASAAGRKIFQNGGLIAIADRAQPCRHADHQPWSGPWAACRFRRRLAEHRQERVE